MNPDPLWILIGLLTVLLVLIFSVVWVRWGCDGSPLPVVAVPPRVDAPPPLLDLVGVSKSYRDPSGAEVRVLSGVTLRIGEGMTAIIGPSGRGKSTLLNLLGGLDTPDAGVIRFRGAELPREESPALRAYRGENVGFVFQDLNLITHLTAAENVALPLLCRGASRSEALEKARQNLRHVGLEKLTERRPAQLSGGEKQRVAITRAFTAEADFILADEPTGSLDPHNARIAMELFADLARRQRRPVILVTHDEELAHEYCDRVLRCTEAGLEEVSRRTPVPQLASPPAPPLPRSVSALPRRRSGLRLRVICRTPDEARSNHKEDRS